MDLSLDVVLRERLNGRRGQWPRIAASAEVSHSWLSQFARDKIPNPGFVTLKKLAEAMDAIPAEHLIGTEGAPAVPAPQEVA